MAKKKVSPKSTVAKKRSRSKASAALGEKQSSKKAAASAPTETTGGRGSKPTKTAAALELLYREDGATIAELMAATGWQAHSVRGFLSGKVRKGLKLALESKPSDAGRCYWIEPGLQ